MNTRELVEQARALQTQYWSANADEKQRLIAEGVDSLNWEKSLRLLHLTCLDLISTGPGKDELASDDPSDTKIAESLTCDASQASCPLVLQFGPAVHNVHKVQRGHFEQFGGRDKTTAASKASSGEQRQRPEVHDDRTNPAARL